MVELNVANRRKEERVAASGEVFFHASEPYPLRATGQLLDRSSGGFRASHRCADIRTGVVLQFRIGRVEGKAQAMWTRIADGIIETGFRILA